MSTETDVHDALASHTDDYEVRERLHEVPPHATYEVTFEGQRAVCKLATNAEGDPAMEARLLQHVDRTTSVPVPRVLAVGDDHLVAAWSNDVPQDPGDVDESRARTMGAGLARLHEETAFDATGFFAATDGSASTPEPSSARLPARPPTPTATATGRPRSGARSSGGRPADWRIDRPAD